MIYCEQNDYIPYITYTKNFKKLYVQVDSAFHPSKDGKMSTRNIWELSGKK